MGYKALWLFVGDDFVEVGDMLLDGGDFFGPASRGWVGFAGGVAPFRLGEAFGSVLESLLEGGAGHMGEGYQMGSEVEE